MKIVDITGRKYGKLTAISFHHKEKGGEYWLFKCDCGKECVIRKNSVTGGYSTSCGCQKGSSKESCTWERLCNQAKSIKNAQINKNFIEINRMVFFRNGRIRFKFLNGFYFYVAENKSYWDMQRVMKNLFL
ncbi:MAG: hypothetical protein NC124_02550 [Clostridium sp.]|nr:hypothetical protein [Clostridium sp.]